MRNLTTLGKALPIRYGKARNEISGFVAESVPVYGSSGVIGEFNRALTTGPALIVGRKGSAGSIHYSATPCWPIDTVYYAETPPDSTLHYFKYLLEHLRLGQHDKSTAIPSLGRDDYNAIPVSVPLRGEQDRVVSYLDEQLSRLDASVAALHRVQANLKRYRASVLKAACEGRLVPTEAELAGEERRDFETGAQLRQRILAERRQRLSGRNQKVAAGPTVTGLPEVPIGWDWATLPQLGELNRGKSRHRPRDDNKLYGGPYPFVQTGDVRHADGILSRHTQTYSEFGLAQSRLWPTGTLCITIAANIAETARLSYAACFPDSIVGFVCDCGEVMTKWVQMFLATAKENLETFAPGTAQKNINLEVLQNVAVPLPPLTEQHRIVAEADRRISLIRAAEVQVTANLARAQRLRQSILHAAFATPASAGQ